GGSRPSFIASSVRLACLPPSVPAQFALPSGSTPAHKASSESYPTGTPAGLRRRHSASPTPSAADPSREQYPCLATRHHSLVPWQSSHRSPCPHLHQRSQDSLDRPPLDSPE